MKRSEDGGTDWIDETFTFAHMFTVIIAVKLSLESLEWHLELRQRR